MVHPVLILYSLWKMANFVSPNQIQNHIRLVLLVLTNTRIRYHQGTLANFVSPSQIQIQIVLVLLVRADTRDDTSQPFLPATSVYERRRTRDRVALLQSRISHRLVAKFLGKNKSKEFHEFGR